MIKPKVYQCPRCSFTARGMQPVQIHFRTKHANRIQAGRAAAAKRRER